ncbi:hypothetical protein CDD81_4749 [Ophiocordyceps australis]|uniref:Uncharacterized protein n=1 Tax=Ophiocordyceps australis TaxID=1399860 RepID=A0A2C5Y443_9HYPO|nr:hypothetical protein CDD81_4749 [Ophiocordyceps australis]
MSTPNQLTRDALFNVKDRVALVTGGGSGIGLMTAQTLAANGAKVYICGRTKEKLDTVASLYAPASGPGQIIPLEADISSKQGIQSLVDAISQRESHLCILVNNAGIGSTTHPTGAHAGPAASALSHRLFASSSPSDWAKVCGTNVAPIFFVTAALLPLLQASTDKFYGWSATVINVGSVAAEIKSSQSHFNYNASKAAAAHLSRMLAAEVVAAGLRLRINVISPGIFPSEMTTGSSDEGQRSYMDKDAMAHIPARRPGKDVDMASAMLFLVCNQYINGQTLTVDGGMTLSFGR